MQPPCTVNLPWRRLLVPLHRRSSVDALGPQLRASGGIHNEPHKRKPGLWCHADSNLGDILIDPGV